ncbi:MAG TPA: trigger factor [Thermoanaerobaculia bacterium]|jgi:trigger factor|nr:trigger factor [Thermoanaerobaculia bacterium]
MSVVVSVQDVGPCRKQLTIAVPAPAVEAETERVVQEYGRKVRIPGFRKGKVPSDLVRRRYQKDIEHEVVERLLPRYWRQAQAESEIDPLLPPEVDEVQELRPGEALTFVASVDTRPKIELGDLHDFNLPSPEVDPGEVEIEEALEDLRRQVGTWVPVERPAARGDLVSARITELPGDGDEGKPPEDAAGKAASEAAGKAASEQSVEIEVGNPQVWEELSLALTGLAPGQETRFTRVETHEGAPGSDEPAHEHKRSFRVEAVAVKERELPPLDDELASRLSPELKSLEELRTAVVRRLRAQKEEQRREARQKALLDQLRERHPLELPARVVEQEVEKLLQDYAESLARQGVDVERSRIDWNEVAAGMRSLAERRVHARLLLDAVAEAEGLALEETEFEATLAALARAQNSSTPALRKSLDEQGRLATLRAQLLRDKTIRHLLGELPEPAEVITVGNEV